MVMSVIADCFRRTGETPGRKELKGYKVTDAKRSRKFGVACRDLQELKRKACLKLNITDDFRDVNVFLSDGFLIDDEYFHTLAPQTTLILQRPGEIVLSDADLFYEVLRRVNIDFLTAGEKVSLFLTENLKAKVAVLNSILNKDDSMTAFSKRHEHPEWFKGLETNVTSKEAYMHRRCQDRIRGYLYKTIEQIRASDVFVRDRRARRHLLQAIAFFRMQLKEDHYFGYYFDRSRACGSESPDSIDGTDSFACYDHCPCKLQQFDSECARFLAAESHALSQSDEIDARKFSPAEKANRKSDAPSDDVAEIQCPYKIQQRELKEVVSLCNRDGEFRCEGVWNADTCAYGDRHKINPYRSREELVLFSTWNLDHRIERSRSLIPHLLKLSESETVNEEDIIDCYNNLFTKRNLKLVHIICHDKGLHK